MADGSDLCLLIYVSLVGRLINVSLMLLAYWWTVTRKWNWNFHVWVQYPQVRVQVRSFQSRSKST